MSNDGKRYKWMLAGSMLGMMGVYAGQSMMHSVNSVKGSKKTARKVTAKASRLTRDAGDFISAVGETMLDRIKQ